MGNTATVGRSVTVTGDLRADTDGTGQSYGDPTHANHTSAMMNGQGQIVPRRTDQIGHNGNRDLNSDTDPYVEAPQGMGVHLGDRAVVSAGGHQAEGFVADYGPAGHVETSVAIGGQLGYRPILVQTRQGPEVDFSADGHTTPDIRATITYYPSQ